MSSWFSPHFSPETDRPGNMYTGEIYSTAIVFAILAWLSWLLCIAPLVWHISQRNVAASSLVVWMILCNFPLGINAIIWGHDKIDEWWDGAVWCDIIARLQVAAEVSLGACVAMILRRLAQVMDTRNITVAISRGSKMRRNLLELAWCWGYPLVLVLFYIPIQSVRYHIWGIEGCNSAYDPTWKSLVLNTMWIPITSCMVVYYAVLLLVRLYRYRREFSRLVTSSNTTRSRFLRLFMMCMVFLLVVVPYSIYPFYYFCVTMTTYKIDEAWWNSIKDHRYEVILKFQSNGMVHLDKWGQIAMGFVTFLLFGTGTDAHNTYKKMLLFFGLGKIFPSLYIMRESSSSTPSSFIAARVWTESCVSKAKSYLSKRSSFSSFSSTALNESPRCDSVTLENMDDVHLRSVSSTTPVLPEQGAPSRQPSLLRRLFTRGSGPGPLLPLFKQRAATPAPESEKAAAEPAGEGFTARAWAADSPSSTRNDNPAGVVVFREVHLNEEPRESGEQKPAEEWTLRA